MAVRSKLSTSPTWNMSSMTDLVFLLLIFFILTSTLVSINALEIELPNAATARTEQQVTVVNINKQGNFLLNEETVEPSMLESRLLTLLEEQSDRNIVVRADKSTAVEQLVFVLDIAQRNAIKTAIATQVPSNSAP